MACFHMSLEEVISLKILATDFAIMPFGCQIGFWATFFNNLAFNFRICEEKQSLLKQTDLKANLNEIYMLYLCYSSAQWLK